MKFIGIIQLFVVCLSLFAFSCSPQGKGILNSKSTFSETIDNATKQAPFAYDIAADTISYNSCVNFVNDTSVPVPIPGLTIGVSEGFVTTNGNGAVKGGLKLKTEFLKHVGKFFKPQSPSLTVTPQQVLKVLNQSPANASAFFQYSIRRKSGLGPNIDLISPGADGDTESLIPQKPRDVAVFERDLTTGFLGHLLTKDIKFTQSGTVLSEGPRSYNLSDIPEPVPLVASFGLNQTADVTAQPQTGGGTTNKESVFGVGELYADSVRKRFNSNGSDKILLTAVFGGSVLDIVSGSTITAPDGEESISQIRRKTPTDVSKAFGRSYTLKFEPRVRGVSGWLSNVMSGTAVTETDLSTGTTVVGAQWSCENFVIALPAHFDNKKLNEPTCSPLMGTDMTESRQLSIKKIRRQHSANDWRIGLFIPKDFDMSGDVATRVAKRSTLALCVSPNPSKGSCYLPTTGVFDAEDKQQADMGIQYDTTKECYLTAFNLLGVTYSNAATADAKRLLGRCAQYLSVCTRSSTNF